MEGKPKAAKELNFRKGFMHGLPIGVGYFPMALAVAISLTQAGVTFWMNQVFASTTYSATAMLAFLNLLKGGETALVMYLLTLFIMNFRYVIFGISMAQRMHPSMTFWQRLAFGILNTDEIYIVAVQNEGKLKAPYLFGLSIMPMVGMVAGSVMGALFTNLLSAPMKSALNITIFAIFISILMPAAKKSRPVLCGAGIATGISYILECIPAIKQYLKPGQIIISCAILTALVGAVLFPVSEKEENINE